MSKVELKTISELLDKKFVVPLYQRGYRWETQQVKDLLEDIDEFIRRHASGAKKAEDKAAGSSVVAEADDFYCLQPLAVKEKVKDFKLFSKLYSELFQENKAEDTDVLLKARSLIENNVCWEVIDGQQRLTTIFIILHYLKVPQCFDIEFDRWKNEQENENGDLANVVSEIAKKIEQNDKYEGTIDRWHISTTYKEIGEFFRVKNDEEKSKFRDALLNKVQFIWYESDEEDPVKVFTRLNIGKIALTNSELIKALLLNRSNFAGADFEKIHLRQMEIASRWDEIETTLQNDEFWMFIHSPGFDKPTRIDFIFDLVCEMNLLKDYQDEDFKKKKDERIGRDKYRTFRYFNEYFHSPMAAKKASERCITLIEQCWQRIDSVFAAFREWFDDLKFYHYVGFLVACGCEIDKILTLWQDVVITKCKFLVGLKDKIRECIKGCKDLGKQYETEDGKNPKTICRPLLLLHNIQTVIDQNRGNKSSQNVFYKFPFHLYKSEGWDVEHIDSNSENDLDDRESQCEFMLNRFLSVTADLREQIEAFINNADQNNFNELKAKTDKELGEGGGEDQLGTEEKNQIWNFALLDSSTNRSYGNAIFSAKRRIIIGKDRGRPLSIPRIVRRDKKNVLDVGNKAVPSTGTVFIPPCTRYVFFKYYSPVLASPNYWRKPDAQSYRQDIFDTLQDFGVTMPKGDD